MRRLFSLIYNNDIHPAAGAKVIAAEDFSTLLEAFEILNRAKEDSTKHRDDVEAECVELKKQAEETGFQEGLARVAAHLMSLDQEKKRLRHEMNKLILPLALKAAKKIVAKELETHPETIVDIVMQALTPVMQNHRIAIYVNKADRDILEHEKPELLAKMNQVESFTIKERDDIAQGGCIIETESGIINATVENLWRAIESAFERHTKI
jgi:type III secretion protein L